MANFSRYNGFSSWERRRLGGQLKTVEGVVNQKQEKEPAGRRRSQEEKYY